MDNRNFYISAYIAFGSYFTLIFVFVLYLTVNNVKKIDAFSKDTVLELDIILQKDVKKDLKPMQLHSPKKDTKIAKKIVKKSTSVSAKKRTNLKSLFANVKTKARKIKKAKISNVKKSSITSRFKSKFEKQSKSNNTISKLLNKKNISSIKKKSGDVKNDKDPYISKIYDILYKRWNPLLIVDGLSAKVLLTIYLNGEFKYRVLQYSGDSTFDDQLVLFLENQKEQYFPAPNKAKIDIEVIFTAKG